MKKLNIAMAFALGLTLPFGAMAASDDEVTIRVMGMNEQAADSVMKQIVLPDAASDKARANVANANQNRNSAQVREDLAELDEEPVPVDVINMEEPLDPDTGGSTGTSAVPM